MTRLAGRLVTIGLVAAVLVTAPASAQLRATPNPLPGSSFQGADGDQTDAPPLQDWQGLQAAGRVEHLPDDNEEDTEFAGGARENEPGNWGLTTSAGGVNPGKDNIFDVFAAVDQPAEDTFVYLAFTRESSGGDVFLAFELNRDDRLWDNGRARIPCRRTGDLQISYEGVGSDVEVVLRRWRTTDADENSGCAVTGTFEDAAAVDPDLVQGALNTDAILSHLPGNYQRALPSGRFGETALNLSRLLDEAFGTGCLAFASMWAHSRASESVTSQMKDYVAPQPLAVRSCAASGTKFFDSNANGRRDPDEPGVARFVIWADYDDDGVQDEREPFSVTDREGEYVILDIRPPDGTYMLRERLLAARSRTGAPDWICSYPNDATPGGTGSAPGGDFPCGWGPIDADRTPNADGRDFGNWFPARLTVEKQLEPSTDPARFDLLVDGAVVFPAAGDGDRVTLSVPPGEYTVAERPVPGVDPALFSSSVDCRKDADALLPRAGALTAAIALAAGEEGGCVFRNVRIGFPAIAIRKTGPAHAMAGDTLRYTLRVSNPGFVAFAEGAISVTDARCDDPPQLESKQGDPTPDTLDPGDEWIYGCSFDTGSPGGDCEPSRVSNGAVVTGTAGDTTVQDDDTISTDLDCPDTPKPPPPIDPPGPAGRPDPDEPAPVAPAGPRPPNAGDAGRARFLFRQATRRCLRTRVPRVDLRGTRIDALQIYVNGRLRRDLNMRTLQARRRPRVTLPPGRHRVTVRVTFERGSATAPLRLTRTVRVCGRRAALPRFTG